MAEPGRPLLAAPATSSSSFTSNGKSGRLEIHSEDDDEGKADGQASTREGGDDVDVEDGEDDDDDDDADADGYGDRAGHGFGRRAPRALDHKSTRKDRR